VEIGTVVVVVEAGAVVVVVLARTVVDADAVLALESPVLTFATVVNVYAVPAVKPVIVHDPDAPETVHLAPPGVAVTSYEVGVKPPVGAVTVIVALSSPATTLGVPGVFGVVLARGTTGADSGPRAVPVGVVAPPKRTSNATVENVYVVPAVRPVIVHDPDAPMTSHLLPTPTVYTRYHAGWSPDVGAATVAVTLSMPATTVGAGGTATAALADPMINGNGATTAVLAMRATTRARTDRELRVFNT
jgi:hypothetical protein